MVMSRAKTLKVSANSRFLSFLQEEYINTYRHPIRRKEYLSGKQASKPRNHPPIGRGRDPEQQLLGSFIEEPECLQHCLVAASGCMVCLILQSSSTCMGQGQSSSTCTGQGQSTEAAQ